MERLTARDEQGFAHYPYCFEKCDGDAVGIKCQTRDFEEKICNKLAEYEDMEEQGLLLKLPCKVGDTVKLNACCECISILPNTICPFENDCDCEDCGNGTEREFTTTVESVYNNGFGWYVTLKHFDIEIPVFDFGRTIFLTEQEAQSALEKMKGE